MCPIVSAIESQLRQKLAFPIYSFRCDIEQLIAEIFIMHRAHRPRFHIMAGARVCVAKWWMKNSAGYNQINRRSWQSYVARQPARHEKRWYHVDCKLFSVSCLCRAQITIAFQNIVMPVRNQSENAFVWGGELVKYLKSAQTNYASH